MSYKIGNCAQCGTKIMVKDASGRWATLKANRVQIDLSFSNGQRVRVAMCKSCASEPNYQKIIDEITDTKSTAFSSDDIKEKIKLLGEPTAHQEKK